MSGIVAFTKDWNDIPTSGMHVPWQMGKSEPLLWISSIGTRTPSLGSGRDLGRILSRLRSFFQPAEHTQDQIWVKSPVLYPKASQAWQIQLSRFLLRQQTRRTCRRLQIKDPEVWSFVPNAGDYVDCFKPSRVIYYCVDDWEAMHGMDGAWLRKKEDQLLQKSDVVFATSERLVEKLSARCQCPVHYAPHGVDHAHFASALDIEPSPLLSQYSEPLIGFIGTLDARLDFELLEKLIPRLPEYRFVFAGPERCDVSRIKQFANVTLLGQQPYADLPALCRAFRCAIVPYDTTNPYNQSVNPIKVREFLASGLPVLATPLPELQQLEHVRTASSLQEWQDGLQQVLRVTEHRKISESMLPYSWESRVMALREKIL